MATVGFSAVTSANVVGYATKETEGLKQPSFGACFIPVGGGTTYKLKDLKPTGFDPDADMIQVINPTTLATDARYVYLGKEVADAIAEEEGVAVGTYDNLIGWWDPVIGVGEDGAKKDDEPIEIGQAFLGLFESAANIKFTSSGAVNTDSVAISLGTEKQPFFANPVPATLALKSIVPTGFDPDADMIQVINPTTLATDARYVYLCKEVADAIAEEEGVAAGTYDHLIGWWDPVIGVGEDGARKDDTPVLAGAAFLGLFESGNEISFMFPSPIAK